MPIIWRIQRRWKTSILLSWVRVMAQVSHPQRRILMVVATNRRQRMWREILRFLKSSLPRALKFLEAAVLCCSQGFGSWIKHFAFNGHHVDWTRTAMLKHKLLSMHSKEFVETMMKSWWHPKNLLVFAPKEARSQDDQALMMHPKQANMLNKDYLERVNDLFGDGEFGKMWKDDWQSFGTLFYAAKLNVNAAQESLTTKTPEL